VNILNLTFTEQAVFVLAALVLFTSFALLAQVRLLASVHAFAWQGVLVASATALMAAAGNEPHLYLSALMTLALKALLIPWMLHRLIRRLKLERHQDMMAHPAIVTMTGAAIVIFCYWVVLPIARLELAATRNILAISLSVVLLGMLMMVARRQAVSQVIGFMSMENGLFLAAVAATSGMPLIVELGVAFDVLVAAVLFGVFFLQLRDSIDSLDVDRLNRLTETEREDDL
jgi:hydrogenase-4 component E